MKLATIDAGPEGHAGVVFDDHEILDLWALRGLDEGARALPAGLRAILEAGDTGLRVVHQCLAAVEAMTTDERQALRDQEVLRDFAGTTLRAPIPNPRLILSVGMNYHSHLAEMRNIPVPDNPTAFIKTRASLTGSGAPLVIPPQCPDMVDFEGEFCFVFARPCHRVAADEAMDFVAGYTIANDVSARDWVGGFFDAKSNIDAIQAWDRNIMGKQLPGFTPCGPVLTTRDEIAEPHDLALTTTLNGTVVQASSTGDMIFHLPRLIAYFSQWYAFQPGDTVTTGSPAGVGYGREPKLFMKPGDVISVEIEGIGKLSNPVVAAQGG